MLSCTVSETDSLIYKVPSHINCQHTWHNTYLNEEEKSLFELFSGERRSQGLRRGRGVGEGRSLLREKELLRREESVWLFGRLRWHTH